MHRVRGCVRTALIAVLATAAVVGHGAVADAQGPGCSTRNSRPAFSTWGDTNQYFVATGGTFEGGATGWTLGGGAAVVADQAPWRVNGGGHDEALRLPGTAEASTRTLCVQSNEESMRFFFKSPGVAGASLKVKITTVNERGMASNSWTIGTSSAGWRVSPQIPLPDLRDASGQQWITITFEPVNTPATWVVDDVMIDPWVAR
jgi:hypothetical protein